MSWRLFKRGFPSYTGNLRKGPGAHGQILRTSRIPWGKDVSWLNDHGENGAGVDILIFYIFWDDNSCWDIVEIRGIEDFSSILLIIQMLQDLLILSARSLVPFTSCDSGANHFRVATENWWKLIKQLLFSGSFHISTNIVELVGLAQLYTITDCLSQVLCVQWPGPSSKNSAQTWQIPKKPDDRKTSHLSNTLSLLLVLQPSSKPAIHHTKSGCLSHIQKHVIRLT